MCLLKIRYPVLQILVPLLSQSYRYILVNTLVIILDFLKGLYFQLFFYRANLYRKSSSIHIFFRQFVGEYSYKTYITTFI